MAGLSGRVSSEVSSDVCLGEGSQIQGVLLGVRCRLMCVWVRVRKSRELSGRVSSEVGMGEGSQIQGAVGSEVSSDV